MFDRIREKILAEIANTNLVIAMLKRLKRENRQKIKILREQLLNQKTSDEAIRSVLSQTGDNDRA